MSELHVVPLQLRQIRENYTRIQREEFGRGISADRLDAIIDRYVGGES